MIYPEAILIIRLSGMSKYTLTSHRKVLGRKNEGETVAASSASLRRGIVAAISAHLLEIAATSAFQHYFYPHPSR
jgi:hypothetical protein